MRRSFKYMLLVAVVMLILGVCFTWFSKNHVTQVNVCLSPVCLDLPVQVAEKTSIRVTNRTTLEYSGRALGIYYHGPAETNDPSMTTLEVHSGDLVTIDGGISEDGAVPVGLGDYIVGTEQLTILGESYPVLTTFVDPTPGTCTFMNVDAWSSAIWCRIR